MDSKRKIYLLNSVAVIVLLGLIFFILYTIFLIRNQAVQNEKQRLEKQVTLIGRQIEHTWRRFENEISYNNSTGFHEKLLLAEKLSDYDKNKIKKF
jgi:predicted Holliday junction resolvase-like endonuclease